MSEPNCPTCKHHNIELHLSDHYCTHPKSMGDKMPPDGLILRKIDSYPKRPPWCPLEAQ